MRRHRMVNMILVAANRTGGPIEQVKIAIGSKMLVCLPKLAAGEMSLPTEYNGPTGSHVWRVWLVDENGKRRRGKAICPVTRKDDNRCAVVTLHLGDFVVTKRRCRAVS
ncbi:hypothetical protein ACFO5Q_14835 [Kordiimonas lipolytica]|uniref:Uncharacterized protein n=1 Tax=Kordiimonas lipolytica TaxID=1662421 RepID=A0ABV8UEE4_9PROT|nr:hypothetical protein [Kordiimonas lipolytica]